MATATKKKATPARVAVLRTSVGHVLTIRGNPTAAAVRRFVSEHSRRLAEGEPGGYHDRGDKVADALPAYEITDAAFFPEEHPNEAYDWAAGTPIALA